MNYNNYVIVRNLNYFFINNFEKNKKGSQFYYF